MQNRIALLWVTVSERLVMSRSMGRTLEGPATNAQPTFTLTIRSRRHVCAVVTLEVATRSRASQERDRRAERVRDLVPA